MILLCLLLLPFIGGLLCWPLRRFGAGHARYVGGDLGGGGGWVG